MSLLAELKRIGKGLEHVGGWIDDGLKIAAPLLEQLDPPLLTPIIGIVEALIEGLPNTGPALSETQLQAMVSAVATIEGFKAAQVVLPKVLAIPEVITKVVAVPEVMVST